MSETQDKPQSMPPVPPFVKFVTAAVPMVFDDSLSYYEALCALWKYISDMSDVVNNNATLEEEYIEKFDELKEFVDHYFDNLNVQDEINNKLDEMASDGSLTSLISSYIDPIINGISTDLNSTIAQQNTAIADIRGEVEGVASGSPAGVYATAAALTSADPDHSKIYLVSADGKWYYYANNQWNAGGVYQSSVLTLDKTLTSDSDAPVSNVVGKAIININNSGVSVSDSNTAFTWESGTISAGGAETTETKRIRTSNYIFVKAGSYFNCESGYKFGYAVYKLPYTGTFVSRTNINSDDKTVTDDCYIRIIMGTSGEDVISDPATVYPHLHYYITPAVSATQYDNNVNASAISGVWTMSGGGEYIVENANNSHYKVPVTAGETYHIKYTFKRSEFSINLVDEDDTVIYQALQASDDPRDYYLTIPSSAVMMVINFNISFPHGVYKVESLSKTASSTSSRFSKFRILHSNVGAFNYPDDTTSNTQYIKNWKQMLNDQNVDSINACEWTDSFNSQNMSSELIEPLMRNESKGHNNALMSSYKGDMTNLGVLTVTSSVGDLSTYAYHALKSKLFVGDKEVILYEVHLAYSPGYETLRQAQYQDLIDDVTTNGYKYVIFAGDFNAQTISEYDIFKNNGYTLCNGGYTGEYDTLRDITADNIIFTPNIKLSTFKVIEGYNLNTDHKPIMAELSI